MKIKYQQGGAMSLPFAVYQPFILPEETSSEGKSGTSKKENNNQELDQIYDVLKELKGLPGDRYAVTNKLQTLLKTANMKLNDPTGNTGSIESEYLQILNYVQDLQNQQTRYDKAYEHAMENGSLGEVVIDSYGRVMAVGDDGFDWITPEEYSSNPNDYQLITNGQLLKFREQGRGGLAFDSDSINAVASSISTKDLIAQLQATISHLGKETNSQESYVATRANKLIKGIQDYQEALNKSGNFNASVQDLHKAKLLTENQARQAAAALTFLYTSLPENYKSLLKIKTNGQDSGAKALIGTLITLNSNETVGFDIDLEHSSQGVSSSTSSSSGEPSNPYRQIMNGEGGVDKTFYLVPGDNVGYKVDGTYYAQVPRATEDMSLEKFLNTGIQGLVQNVEGITFGDQKIKQENFKDIMYDNSGVATMILPITKDMLGNISVNFEYVEILNQIDKIIAKQYPNATKEEKEKYRGEMMKEAGLDSLVGPNGLPNYSKFARFLVIPAYTTDRVPMKNYDSDYIEKIKNPSSDLESRLIKGLSSDEDKSDYSVDIDDYWAIFEWGYDDIYRGNVFIPLNNNLNSADMAWGENTKESSVSRNEQLYQDFNKLTNMKPTNETK